MGSVLLHLLAYLLIELQGRFIKEDVINNAKIIPHCQSLEMDGCVCAKQNKPSVMEYFLWIKHNIFLKLQTKRNLVFFPDND